MTSFQGKLVKKVLQPEQTIKKDTNNDVCIDEHIDIMAKIQHIYNNKNIHTNNCLQKVKRLNMLNQIIMLNAQHQ